MSSAPRTPYRAITTALSSKSSASVPPASSTYEPLVKAALSHRLVYTIFLASGVSSWLITSVWTAWNAGGMYGLGLVGWLLNPLQPATIALGLAGWVLGVVPVIVLRKAYLTSNPIPASSPSKTVSQALARPSTARGVLVYAASAVVLTALHVFTSSDLAAVDVFVRSRKHPYYLNGRFLFLLFNQLVLATAFMLRNIMLDRFTLQWHSAPSFLSPKHSGLHRTFTLAFIFIKIGVFTALVLALSSLLFGVGRMVVVPLLFKLPFLRQLFRPFLGHVVSRRSSYTLTLPLKNLGLLFRAFFLGSATALAWEIPNSLFDAIAAEPITVAQSTADPVLTLVSGTTSTDPAGYFQHAAFTELALLAHATSPISGTQRSALFADQKYNPNLWSTLLRTSLLELGRDYQLLLRRGAPLLASPAVAAAKPPPKKAASTPLKKGAIFKTAASSPVRSVLDGLASDGTISRAVDETTQAGVAHLHVPELFRSVGGAVQNQIPAVPEARKAIDGAAAGVPTNTSVVRASVQRHAGKIQQGVRGRAPVWALEVAEEAHTWWTRDRVAKVAERCVPRREMDVLIIEVLSHLVCASLEEDRYGVVQRDIPRVLEAFVSFLAAVEEYRAEVHAKAPSEDDAAANKPIRERMELEAHKLDVFKAEECLAVVHNALNDGVMRIVRTFGDKLGAFKFPPRVAERLQGFAARS